MLADSPVVDYSISKKKTKGDKKDYSNKNIAEKAAEALRRFEESKNNGTDNISSLNINGKSIKM